MPKVTEPASGSVAWKLCCSTQASPAEGPMCRAAPAHGHTGSHVSHSPPRHPRELTEQVMAGSGAWGWYANLRLLPDYTLHPGDPRCAVLRSLPCPPGRQEPPQGSKLIYITVCFVFKTAAPFLPRALIKDAAPSFLEKCAVSSRRLLQGARAAAPRSQASLLPDMARGH